MKVRQLKILAAVFLFLPALVFSTFAFGDLKPAESSSLPTLPTPAIIIPAAPSLAAKSYVLVDYLSDYKIAEKSSETRLEPASLTKMMTVYVIDQVLKSNKLRLSDTVKVSEAAWRTQGSRMFLELNSEPTIEELLKGIIIQSGNDASVAIAEHIAGTESAFTELMNFYAKKLNMQNTHFKNATGLPDPDQYTTAADMALLAKAVIRDFPETYKLYSHKEFMYNNIKQPNRNRLLWQNDSVDGIKTGHTDSAGFCLVASGLKDGMRLISVVMGAQSDNNRIEETNKLLTYGFRFFETQKLLSGQTTLKQAPIWMGKIKEITLGLQEDLFITLGKGQKDRLTTDIQVAEGIKAPVQKDAPLGTVSVSLEGKILAQRPLVALASVEEAGFFKRLYDSMIIMVQSWFKK